MRIKSARIIITVPTIIIEVLVTIIVPAVVVILTVMKNATTTVRMGTYLKIVPRRLRQVITVLPSVK